MTPQELESLLLRAALLPGRPALAAWQRATQATDYIDRAPYRLLPQLYRNLQELGVDDPGMATLKGVYRHSWASNQRVLADAGALLPELDAAGVDAIVLGGIALSSLYYADGGSRPVAPIELLVRTADVQRTVTELRNLGWRANGSTELGRLMRMASWTQLERADANTLRLHWSPFWEPVPE